MQRNGEKTQKHDNDNTCTSKRRIRRNTLLSTKQMNVYWFDCTINMFLIADSTSHSLSLSLCPSPLLVVATRSLASILILFHICPLLLKASISAAHLMMTRFAYMLGRRKEKLPIYWHVSNYVFRLISIERKLRMRRQRQQQKKTLKQFANSRRQSVHNRNKIVTQIESSMCAAEIPFVVVAAVVVVASVERKPSGDYLRMKRQQQQAK